MILIKRLYIFALMVVPILYFPLVEHGNYSQSPKQVALVLTSCFILGYFLFKGRKTIDLYLLKCDICIIVYFALSAISGALSKDFLISIYGSLHRSEGLVTILVYIVLFYFARNVRSNIARVVLVGSTIVSIIGILQRLGINVLPTNYITEGWTNVAYSTIGNPNFLGSYLVLVLPIAMYEYVGLKKWYGIPIYGLLFYCLLATMSRGPWLGAMFAFGSVAFLMWKYGKFDLKRFSALVVLSLSLILLFNITSNGALLSRFKTIGNDIGEVVSGGENIEQAGSYRMFIWIRSFELVKQNPIWGVGIEQLGYAFIDNYSDDMIQQFGYVGFIDRAHNEYLHIAVSSGIPSLLLYLLFLWLVLRAGWINLSKNSMLIPVYSAVLGYLLQAFFNISVVSVAYLFWIYLGFLVSVDTRDKTS